jgi:uncharacterized integral membrane protein
MEFLKELFRFIRQRKKWWLLPVILLLLLLALLIFVGTGTVIGPFIYTLF